MRVVELCSVVVAYVRNWLRWRHLRTFSATKLIACRTTSMLVLQQLHNIPFMTVSYAELSYYCGSFQAQ